MYGYAGKLLFVNLSTGAIEVRDLKEQDARDFIGGYGLGAKILYEEMPANADPYGEDSMIGFTTGPVTATGAMFGGRFTVVHKSPVYNGWNDANCGGFFGPALKRAGYDCVFVNGIADKPVYIFIEDGKVEILDAGYLWGKTTMQTEKALAEKHGDKLQSALIAPSGENLSLIAAVMNDEHRAAGRGGCGAVMGSKKLKAIVVRGNQEIPVFDKSAVAENNRAVIENLRETGTMDRMGAYGTGAGYVASTQSGDCGVKNWGGSGVTDHPVDVATPIGSQGIDFSKTKKYACANCPLGCGAFHDYPSDKWDLKNSPRPEYETQGAFGAMLCNADVAAVFQSNNLCNEYGLDTISAGCTVAWAMECYNNGVLSKAELDGIELTWGNGEAIVAITEKMGKGEGVGKILMMGSKAAADHFGKGHEYLVVASGIEEPMHDSRFLYGLARTYQYDPTPGRHVKGGFGFSRPHTAGHSIDYRGTGYFDLVAAAGTEIMNSSGYCMFGQNNPRGIVKKQVEATTGFKYSGPEWLALGIRIFNMRHAFNLREGLRRKDFYLSKRLYETSTGPFDGPLAGINVNHELLADNFFNAIGWDMDMVPYPQMFEAIGGLDFVKTDLYPPAEKK